MKIPRCMSTQHPDNVNIPFFASEPQLGGEDEIHEAYYAFSHLGCDEQMWDCEGKEVDNYVIKKLLTKYPQFFKEKKLGQDVFITLRVPNPQIERNEAKILLETLESIPRSFDTAQLFYSEDITPIFEVILPMTDSAASLDRIYRYYKDFIVGKQDEPVREKDITIAEWIGKFCPKEINVIPLFEDMPHLLNVYNVTMGYLENKNVKYQRVFLARSDPAMNYGLISAVLLNKIALKQLQKVEENSGVKIYPIVGAGSPPFRGNLKPKTVERVVREYPSAYTFTVQSAFKYDNPPEEVKQGVKILQERKTGVPSEIDEKKSIKIIEKYSKEYQRQIVELAPVINEISKYVPSRRKRKLHIGLFGYSRSVKGVSLPRVITFTCALYSIGLPPEILGINALTTEDWDYIKQVYINFEEDLKEAMRYLNTDTTFLSEEVKKKITSLKLEFSTDKEHKEITDHINTLLKERSSQNLSEYILRAAYLRKFLG